MIGPKKPEDPNIVFKEVVDDIWAAMARGESRGLSPGMTLLGACRALGGILYVYTKNTGRHQKQVLDDVREMLKAEMKRLREADGGGA